MKQVLLHIPVNSLGFGIFSIGYASILSKWSQAEVKILPISNNVDRDILEEIDPELNVELIDLKEAKQIKWDAILTIWHPEDIARVKPIFPDAKHVSFTHFETTKLQDKSIRQMEEMSSVGCCSVWGRHVINSHTIKVNTFACPGPLISEDVFQHVNRQAYGSLRESIYTNLGLDSSRPLFISGGKWEKRKGHPSIIEAIEQIGAPITLLAFWNNVFLKGLDAPIAHLRNSGWKFETEAIFDSHKIFIFKYSNGSRIILFPQIPKYRDVLNLYAVGDVYIAASAGEGCDMPALENMNIGNVCLLTDNTAHMEYLSNTPNTTIGTFSEIANDGVFFNGTQGYWYPADLTCLKKTIEFWNNSSRDLRRTTGMSQSQHIQNVCEDKKILDTLSKELGI